MHFFKRRAVRIIAFFFIVLSCLVFGQIIYHFSPHIKSLICGYSILVIIYLFWLRAELLEKLAKIQRKNEKQADYISELEKHVSFLDELITYSHSSENRLAYKEQIKKLNEKLKALQDKNNQLVEKNDQLNEKNNLQRDKIHELEEENGKKGGLCYRLIHVVQDSGILKDKDSKGLERLNGWLQATIIHDTANTLRESLFSGLLGKTKQ